MAERKKQQNYPLNTADGMNPQYAQTTYPMNASDIGQNNAQMYGIGMPTITPGTQPSPATGVSKGNMRPADQPQPVAEVQATGPTAGGIDVETYRKYLQNSGNAAWVPENNPWYTQAQQTLEQINNRDPFQFDLNASALYQMYKNQAIVNGQYAMRDTMGQAAGLTGGYGSSYAQNAGQQAYNRYLETLNDKVPDIYAQERAMYDQQGDDLYKRWQMLQNMYNSDYDRWLSERNWNYQQERDRISDQLQREQIDYNRAQDQRSWDEKARSESQQRAEDIAWKLIGIGQMPSDEILAAAGLDKASTEALVAWYAQQMALAGMTGGSGGSGGGYRPKGSGDTTTPDTTVVPSLSDLDPAAQSAVVGALGALQNAQGSQSGGFTVNQDDYAALRHDIQAYLGYGNTQGAQELFDKFKAGMTAAQIKEIRNTFGLK